MNYLNEPSKICLTYGSIISFMLDQTVQNDNQIFSTIPKQNNEYIKFDQNPVQSINEDFSDILISREFLYSQGVFNENCFFHNFRDKNELKHNYYNSLFLVLPKGEYDSITKFRAMKRRLKKEIIMEEHGLDKQQICDCYTKFKQEIETNLIYAVKLLNAKDNFINFNDCVQFMHIKSGKFLEFKKHNESLKIYIQLTETLSENTLFRFVPGYNYQSENSAKVMINLILKIACGEKHSTDKEKFLSKNEQTTKKIFRNFNSSGNIKNAEGAKLKALTVGKELFFKAAKIVEEAKYKHFEKAKNARNSLKDILNDNKTPEMVKNNFITYINSFDLPHKNFGKKFLPNDDETIIAGNRSFNFWRIILFSKNFLKDNKYINSLDYFCIQNNDKNLFIQSKDYKTILKEKKNKYKNSNSLEKKNKIEENEASINDVESKKSRSISSDVKYKKFIKDTTKTIGSSIRLDYFYDQEFGSDLNYDLIVNHFEENDYIEPLGLFKFEFIYKTGKFGVYGSNPKFRIDLLQDDNYVRLINIFTNKVLMVDLKRNPLGNKFILKLVNSKDIDKVDYYKTIFVIEKINDYEDTIINDNKDKIKKKIKSKKSSKNKNKDKINKIDKNDCIKIKSKKYNVYLGIRLNNEQKQQTLVLTDSISDLTKFKLNFLDEIDKYELHFFEQLLWSFTNILNYFKSEKESFSENSVTLENYSNYEKIQHILITLENKINNFPENNKVNISQKNKFDFMKVIEHFNIVSKLIDLFLANWFKDYQNLNYYEMEKKLEKYFQVSEEKQELTLLKCKKFISKKIFKILKMIYDLNQSYLNVIVDRLLYFFMFIGRDDKCTKFLIYILRNNGTLLISLCPLYNRGKSSEFIKVFNNQILNYGKNTNNRQNNLGNRTNHFQFNNNNQINNQNNQQQNKYNCFKHCLKRIIKTYNCLDMINFNINFSSVFLLFDILKCLHIYNQKPFNQFYDEYFKELQLLKTVGHEASPNYEMNPLFVKFILKDDKIYVKKRKFFSKKNNNNINNSFIQKLPLLFKIKSNFGKEIYPGLTNNSKKEDEFEFELSELIDIISKNDINNDYNEIILSKLVSLNILFYSYISLCNQELKCYLKKIFNFDIIINNYLMNNNQNDSLELHSKDEIKMIINSDFKNDLKCSLTQLLNYLYFRISFPFSGKMDLFYCLEKKEDLNNLKINLHSSIIHIEAPKTINKNDLDNVVNYIYKILININEHDIKINNDPFLLYQFFESIKYIIRNLYIYKDEEKINKSIDFISLVLLLLDKYIGVSSDEKENKDIKDILDIIHNDSLNTNDDLYLISDNSKLIFEKYRKKLEKILKYQDNLSQKKLFKNLFSILISQNEGKNYYMNMESYKDRKRSIEKLKKYDLSNILMEISINRNLDQKSMIDEILFMISDIFLEFLLYIEKLKIDEVFNKIYKLSKDHSKGIDDQPEEEFCNNLINSLTEENKEKNSLIENKENNSQIENNEKNPQIENKKKNSHIFFEEVMKQYEFHKNKNNLGVKPDKSISFSFFKFLQSNDNVELKNKILQILYRTNSQKKFFYENITNIVLFDTQNDYDKFLKIKDLFIDMINTVHSMCLIKRLDKNALSLFQELDIQFVNFINLLFDEKKWRKENNMFNVYRNINYNENSIINDSTKINRKKSIFNSEIVDKTESYQQYFLNEFTKEKVSMVQQTLFNLGFIELINKIFEYISWVVNTKDDLNDELSSLENILISIYKLLVLFIFDNQKHLYFIKEKLYSYICPLKLKVKNQNILLFIGYFILNVVYFFEEKDDFIEIKHVDRVISSLSILQYLNWERNKKIIPFYVQIFKIIISFSNDEIFTIVYPVLEIINKVLITEILRNKDTNDDLTSLIKILELITNEQDKKCNENKNTSILSLNDIINIYLDMIKLINQESVYKYMKLSQIFIITTNLLYNHFQIYRNDFNINKSYRVNLANTLMKFCQNFKLTEDLIYCNKNRDNQNLRFFNEFIGISIPKLYIILSQLGMNRYNNNNSLSILLHLSNELYERIIVKFRNNHKEKIFLTQKSGVEIEELSRKLPEMTYLSTVKEKIIKSSVRLSLPKIIKSLKTRKNFINKLLIEDEYNTENFSFLWNKIKMKINYNKGLDKFKNFAKIEINEERKNYIRYMNNFFDNMRNVNIKNKENEGEKSAEISVLFFDTYIDTLKEKYQKDFINHKNEMYFFYWTDIHLMRYNCKKKKFIDEYETKDNNPGPDNTEKLNKKINLINYNYIITPFNKKYFQNFNFIDFTLKQFYSSNIYSSYEYLLYIKFLNSYLDQLDEKNMAKFIVFFIEQQETENIFSLIKSIFDSLDKEINRTINQDDENEIKEREIERLKYSSNLFENEFDKYELIIQFITKMSANNSIVQNKMKDYLRVQYNNSKSYNFIIILSNFLEIFTKENSNLQSINKYYQIIIQVIDCITKCCNGPSIENQNCVVKETKLLDFTRYILKKITYRQKIYNDSGLDLNPSYDRYFIDEISENTEDKFNEDYLYEDRYDNDIVDECLNIGLDRQKLSFLKYKLLLLVSVLTIGRKKGDILFDYIHKAIDFDVLACVLIETYKEILIEKNSQLHYESLIFDEEMLLRMDNNISYDNEVNENFIIFEIGTYIFIIINIYLENLTRTLDFEVLNKISSINKELKEGKFHVKKKRIFDSFKAYGESIYNVFRSLCIKCGNCLANTKHEDFYLKNSFYCAYKFFFDYTPSIEVIFNEHLIKYYLKLSPICKCLTEEMKEEFYSTIDRSSSKTKIESLFKNVEYYHYQLVHAKRRLDLFRKMPLLDLLFNHYRFYRDIFMIIGALLNILIFSSFFRTNDDDGPVYKYTEDFNYDYGFLYKRKFISATRNIFFYTTIIQCVISFLILVTYILNRLPNLLYFEVSESERMKYYSEKEEDEEEFTKYYKSNQGKVFATDDYDKMRKNVKVIDKIISFIINLLYDTYLFYHILMVLDCLIALLSQNYRFHSFLLVEIIMHSDTLCYIVKSFWIPRKQIIITLILFYLIAYYFIIFVYIFIPHHLPTNDCFVFSDCFFTLCDQTIKNSNGIINYLVEDGLYITHTLYENPRFWIDNWFAIIDLMLVLQMVCGIIINAFISQRKAHDKIEKDKNNFCFICGFEKNQLNKYYGHEQGFYEHIKLDHYLWNYMFLIFNLIKKNSKNLISIDKNIIDNYKKRIYLTWIPYKKCGRQIETEGKSIYEKNENQKEDESEDEGQKN